MTQPDKLIRECTKRMFSLEPFLQISKIMKVLPDNEKEVCATQLILLLDKSRTESEFLGMLSETASRIAIKNILKQTV